MQKLAAEFPLGSRFELDGKVWHLIGYNESDMLIVTPIDPGIDYDGAYEARELVCADHYRHADTSTAEHGK